MIDLAAEQLGATRDQLQVEDGVVFVTGNRDRQVSYAELAGGRAIARTLDREAVLREAGSAANEHQAKLHDLRLEQQRWKQHLEGELEAS